MMRARDFRKRARMVLSGNWFVAVIAGIIASFFGASAGATVNFNFNYNFGLPDVDDNTQNVAHVISQNIPDEVKPIIMGMGLFAIVFSLITLILGSVIAIGYAEFNLDLVDHYKPKLSTLFKHFRQTKSAIGVSLLIFIKVFVGSIFFILPGVIASYQYSMTHYIMADNPGITARDAMYRSKELMKHNKWRLFCLDTSFIGWGLLGLITFGIADYWLHPYRSAARAAFYREIRRESEAFSW